MPAIKFPRLFALASRSARTVLTRPGPRDMAVTTRAGTPWYRYVGYRGNMPQVNMAGRTQFLTLANDVHNRWTGSDLAGGGRQGLYFSAEFLNPGNPFPELSHYQQDGQDSVDLVSYYEYHPGQNPPIAPEPRVERATNLRSMFLFTLTRDQPGLDFRITSRGNKLLDAVHRAMRADPEFDAVRVETAGQLDVDNLEAMYRHGESADFCRALGNSALEQPDVQYILVTSVRDGVSTNVVARTPVRGPADPPVPLECLKAEGRATFFVNMNGQVGKGVFTVGDLLYNANFESPTNPPPELPEVQTVKRLLLRAQQASIEELRRQVLRELELRPATRAMDNVVDAIKQVQDQVAAEDYSGTIAAVEELKTKVAAAAQDPVTVGEFRATLDLSAGVANSLSSMADAVQATQDHVDGLDSEPPDVIEDPDPDVLDPALSEPAPGAR
jgi:hypothetical protein